MSLPSSARLGPFSYRITSKPKEWARSGVDPERHYGYTDHQRGVIIVHAAASPAMQRTVLLHELMHAAAFAGGQLDNRKRREEDWVAMVAPMLLDALQRSPELSNFLLNHHKEKP